MTNGDTDIENDKEACIFIHFYGNNLLCQDFVNYAKNLNYEIDHLCCGGEGCKINNVDNKTANTIKKTFLKARGIK